MFKQDKIINFDFQGWPEEKMDLRDIIKSFGFTLNEETNMWELSNDDPILDSCPSILEDDGMGYGVNEEFIISSSVDKNKNNIYMFREKPFPNIDKWLELHSYPGAVIEKDGKEWLMSDIVKKDNEFYLELMEFDTDKIAHKNADSQTILFKDAKALLEKKSK